VRKMPVTAVLVTIYLFYSLISAHAAAEPVNFRDLLPLVKVNLPGWGLQGEPQGQTVKTPQMTVSEVEADYVSGSKTLAIKIIDSSLGQAAYSGMGFLQGMEVDTSEETTRGTKIKDFPAVETYRSQDKEARLTILVAQRFLVALEGASFDGVQELKTVAEHLDLAKLAALAGK